MKLSGISVKRGERLLLVLVALLFIVYALCVFVQGTGTFADVLRGYYSLDQWQEGARFNTLTYADGCAESRIFMSWWTPGQYVLPYLLIKTIVPELPVAQNILIVLFLLLALTGYYRLFSYLGFERRITLLALLLIESNQLFFWQSLLYYGGSLFELGLLPWFLLLLLHVSERNSWRYALLLIFPAVVLFTLKATFLLHAFTGLMTLGLLAGKRSYGFRGALIVSGLAIAACCYFGYLQFGETPSTAFDYGTYDAVPNTTWTDCTNAFASIVGIFTGLSPLLHKKLLPEPALNYLSFPLLLLLAVVSLLLLVRLYRSAHRELRFLVIFAGGFFGMMTLLYLTDKAVSYDLRHFAPLGFCFFPFMLAYLLKKIPSGAVLVLSAGLIASNLSLFVLRRWQFPEKMQAFGGLIYTQREARMLTVLEELKRTKGQEGDLYAISDYWLPVNALKKQDVIPYRVKAGTLVLCSGMELDHPPRLHPEHWFACHERIIFILKPGEELPRVFRTSGKRQDWMENGELRIICLTK